MADETVINAHGLKELFKNFTSDQFARCVVAIDASGNVVGVASYTEDAAGPANPAGPALMLLRTDARTTALASADNDWIAARCNSRGELVVTQERGFSASASVTRPADTNPYAAADVIGPTGGGTAAMTFSSIAPNGGGKIAITGAELEIDASALESTESSYSLYLFSVTPPSALADNAGWTFAAGDRASFLAKVNLGIPQDEGATLYVRQNGLYIPLTAASADIFGYLVTNVAYTPSSARGPFKVTLHAESR